MISAGESRIWRRYVRLCILINLIVISAFLSFVFWAYFAEIDEIARAPGTVVPRGRVQVAQNLEGGIISAIYVREGDFVSQNQVLVKLENVSAKTKLQSIKDQRGALLAEIARLRAEASGEMLSFEPEIGLKFPTARNDQARLFNARKQALEDNLSVLESQRRQKIRLIEEAKAQLKSFEQIRKVTAQQKKLAEPLAESGVVPKSEMLSLEKELMKIVSEVQMITLSLPRLEEEAQEISKKINTLTETFRQDAQAELITKSGELAALTQAELATLDLVSRTEVRSPVKGVIKSLKTTTIGSVIGPGDVILEVVPIDDDLKIESRVKPADIAFIAPSQTAHVRISAYDSSIYGFFRGEVESIAADTTRIQNEEPYYRVTIKVSREDQMLMNNSLKIVPGMVAEIDIITGRKTVLDYLLKPIIKAKQLALRER